LPSPITLIARRGRSSYRNNTIHFSPTLGHCAAHLARQHIPETGESLALPLQVLITALDELHKLTRIDVWVPGRVDIVDDLGRELDA
jgi:hypothetical protein